MKNYSKRGFYLLAILLFLLLILRQFSPISIFDYKLKDIDILSDLIKDNSTTPKKPRQIKNIVDTCKAGITCIDDYSMNRDAMLPFFQALNNAKKEAVRVAFFGDSFIEGDILTEDLREKLQEKFGGRGVGYLPITSMLAGCRKTATITDKNIESYWLVGKCNNEAVSIAGNYYLPKEKAYFAYRTGTYRQFIDTVQEVKLFYQSISDSCILTCRTNYMDYKEIPLQKTASLSMIRIPGKIKNIEFSVKKPEGLKLMGAYLDGNTGVSVDNYGMRGNSGIKFLCIPDKTLIQTDSLLHYKLVILQYGLNAVGPNTSDYSWYTRYINKMIAKAKRCFPNASIVLLGIGDHSMRKNGDYVTMPGVINLISEQQQLAADHKIAFWSIYDAMGGYNSMPGFVAKGWAAKDYTHLSFRGGKVIGLKLFDALMYEKEKYKKRGLCD